MFVLGLLETRSNALVIGGCPRPGTGFKGLIDSVSRQSNDIVIIGYSRSGSGGQGQIERVSTCILFRPFHFIALQTVKYLTF